MTKADHLRAAAAEWFRAMYRPSRRSFTPRGRMVVAGAIALLMILALWLAIAQCDGCRAAVEPVL